MSDFIKKSFNKNNNIISFTIDDKETKKVTEFYKTTPFPNYKSDDKIFFGPLEDVKILNGGSNYDVITPPSITLSGPGAGSTTALIRPVITGTVVDVQVDPQDFDIQKVVSVTIEGGNGSGAILEPILSERKREITFDL